MGDGEKKTGTSFCCPIAEADVEPRELRGQDFLEQHSAFWKRKLASVRKGKKRSVVGLFLLFMRERKLNEKGK